MTTYGFLSTYPPTQCGLATFTTALMSALVRPGVDEARVVQSVDSPRPATSPVVVGDLVAGNEVSRRQTVELLGSCDVVVVQHEYGIYGGPDGDEVVAVLEALTVPVIVVLHTVLTDPSPGQRRVLEAVAAAADAVVTMAETPRRRLADGYAVDMTKVSVIPHGAPALRAAGGARTPHAPTVLTWGLIGPGKGIEWGIEAMVHLRDLDPAPHYLVVGETHPKVRLQHGEAYRESLVDRARELGVDAMVTLDDRYLEPAVLGAIVDSAAVVLLPYDSTDQVTSGVLAEAVGAGLPVVATRFPHAVELLSDGAGRLVPQRDPAAMADAIREILGDPGVAARMRRAAVAAAPDLLWTTVGARYRELAAQIATPTARALRP